ncbi:ABC transporter substrate-binding protein [Marinobacterium stanieri]|uniref:Putative ABC transport system substrate-binding protein n=1 Tax=Marinobacterium stanieri TaxID=49186 RepID=A0A1N6R6M2_9GAMM|nr:ABC transporter substrate-binding protein [Marinobacterium stanieri]SIQ24560.1 putative ABC transport system substrate-binding protein [Marinobacterium stanieri]
MVARLFGILISCCVWALPVAGASTTDADGSEATHHIYAVYWRGCEESCQGFKDYLAEHLPSVRLTIKNAQRQPQRLPQLLAEAKKLKPDLILSWGTSVTLAFAGRMGERDNKNYNREIPQIFTIVADPVGAGIVESLEYSGRKNLTGTLNQVPEKVNINAMRAYLPTLKRLGLIYNQDEPNSVLKKEELAILAPGMGLELVALPLAQDVEGKPIASDIAPKVAMLKSQGVEFLYLGSSSFLDTHRDTLADAAIANQMPLFSPYERLVRESGALLSVAARYYEVGRLAGELAEEIIIEKRTPGDIPIARVQNFAYVVNMGTAKKLQLYPSVEMLQFVETVNH